MHYVTTAEPVWTADELVHRYALPLRRFMATLIANPADAEDATQETLLRVARCAERIGARPWRYLTTIARNAANDILNARGSVIDLTDDNDTLDRGYEPFATFEATDASGPLAAALGSLNDRQLAMLVDHAVHDDTDEQIAVRHDTTPGAVRVAVHRARTTTRDTLTNLLRDALAAFGLHRHRITQWANLAPCADHAAAMVLAALVVTLNPAEPPRPRPAAVLVITQPAAVTVTTTATPTPRMAAHSRSRPADSAAAPARTTITTRPEPSYNYQNVDATPTDHPNGTTEQTPEEWGNCGHRILGSACPLVRPIEQVSESLRSL